jgi:hypothetical protein
MRRCSRVGAHFIIYAQMSVRAGIARAGTGRKKRGAGRDWRRYCLHCQWIVSTTEKPKGRTQHACRDPSVLLLIIRRVLFIFKMLMMREKVRLRHKYQGLRSAAGATAGYWDDSMWELLHYLLDCVCLCVFVCVRTVRWVDDCVVSCCPSNKLMRRECWI